MEAKKLIRNAAIGALGGFASTVVMSGFMTSLAKIDKKVKGRAGSQFIGDDTPPATGKVARKVAKTIVGQDISARNERAAGLVHFAFGTGLGVLYGALADRLPKYPLIKGLIYGAGVWLVADEFVLPRTRLSRRAQDYTLVTHAKALAGHLVYGAALEASQSFLAAKTPKNDLAVNQLH